MTRMTLLGATLAILRGWEWSDGDNLPVDFGGETRQVPVRQFGDQLVADTGEGLWAVYLDPSMKIVCEGDTPIPGTDQSVGSVLAKGEGVTVVEGDNGWEVRTESGLFAILPSTWTGVS